jgi:hypothetical protein
MSNHLCFSQVKNKLCPLGEEYTFVLENGAVAKD